MTTPRDSSPPPLRSSVEQSRGDPDPAANHPSQPQVDLELDCREMRCPMPVIELARRLEEVEVGGTIGVATLDVAARVDVPAWCRMRGHEYVGERVAADGVPLFVVRRLP